MKKSILHPTHTILLILVTTILLTACSPKKEEVTANTESDGEKTYTLTEISRHKIAEDCWMAIDGKVYDVTKFIASGMHKPIITEGCGIDASTMFKQQEKHSQPNVQELLAENLIGVLK